MTVLRAAVLALGCVAGTRAAAQDSVSCIRAASVRILPARPVPGTLFVVKVAGEGASFAATLAGEPLQFTHDSSGVRAFGALPIDSVRGATLTFTCNTPAASTTMRILPARHSYAMERLRVDPRFTAPLDSALAERTRQESARAAAVARASRETQRLWTPPFVAPRPSRITSRFGTGRAFNGTVTSRHMGTDYAGQAGAPVRASNRGVVRLVDEFYYGGNVIYVDHGGGFTTAYLHLSQALVAPGDTVERGSMIGRVGATGRVTAAHLHFITRFGEITVDPGSVIAATKATGRK